MNRIGLRSGNGSTPSLRPGALGTLGLCLIATVSSGCSINPATGQKELSFVSESQEIAMGEETQKSTRATIGDYPDANMQRYVSGLGLRLAATSERPGLPWSFELIDDAAVNAFAAPGGKIFVTRGLLPYLGSEAELSGVVGHEIGHVTARHTAKMITRQQIFGIGLLAGSLLSSRVAEMAGGIQQGLQVLFLSFSRDNETQADELGFRYMRRGGYDGRQMPKIFVALGRVSALSGGSRLPTWAATHPDPANREARAVARVAALPPESLGTTVNRDGYLRAIDGIIYGPNPRQGYFEGARFLHPDLRFRIDFPQGWQTLNHADAVLAASPQNDAIVQLRLGGQESPEALLQKFSQQPGVQAGNGERLTVNGLAAATAEFQAPDGQGNALQGRVLYLGYNGTTYQILGYSTAPQYNRYAGVLYQSMRSFDRLTDSGALSRQPRHLVLVRLPRAMTIEEFYREYPSNAPVQEIAAINAVAAGTTLPAGTMAKRVQ